MASLRLVVVDDASTDGTKEVLAALRPRLTGELQIVRNPVNRGHGPSLMTAYRRSLADAPDCVLQVDGDGQFHGGDLRRVLVLLGDDAHAVSGVRRFRQDPWFRVSDDHDAAGQALRGPAFSVSARDPNCPLRGYEAGLWRQLVARFPRIA